MIAYEINLLNWLFLCLKIQNLLQNNERLISGIITNFATEIILLILVIFSINISVIDRNVTSKPYSLFLVIIVPRSM